MATRKVAATKKSPGAKGARLKSAGKARGANVPGWDPKQKKAIIGKAGKAAGAAGKALKMGGSMNIRNMLLAVFRESIRQQNEDKKYWLGKLATIEKALDSIERGAQVARINLPSLADDLNKAVAAMSATSKKAYDQAMKTIRNLRA